MFCGRRCQTNSFAQFNYSFLGNWSDIPMSWRYIYSKLIFIIELNISNSEMKIISSLP